jgi:hypothetical protein
MEFAQSIGSLVADRDKAFVERVAADLGLSYKDLYELYLEVSEAAIKVPRKYKKRDQAEAEPAGDGKCQGVTAKKEPCKFSALKGECFCKRHLGGGAASDKTENSAPSKPVKEAEPVHNHTLDSLVHTDCALCQSHGNPLANEDFDCEVIKA